MRLKKILAGALAAAMAVTYLPQAAFAEDGSSQEWSYRTADEMVDFGYADDGIWLLRYNGTETNVVIPEEIDGYKVIGIYGAFEGEYTTFNGTLITENPSLNGNGEPIVSVTLPKTLKYLINTGRASDPFYNNLVITAIHVDEENPYWTSVDGVLYTKDMTTLYHYPAGKSGTSYTVPNGVKCVSRHAFIGSSLTSITLPEGLVELYYAANGFNLGEATSITIPSTVTVLEGGTNGLSEGFTIKGYAGSVAEEVAEEYGIPFEAIDGVTGVILSDDTDDDGDCGIKVYSNSSVLHDYTLKATQTVDEANRVEYDISLVDSDGEIVQLEGDVTVRMPYPSDWASVTVYYADDAGNRTNLWSTTTTIYNREEVEQEDGSFVSAIVSIEKYAFFSNDHFSTYGAGQSTEGTDNGEGEGEENGSGNGSGTDSTGNTGSTSSGTTATTTTEATTTAPAANGNGAGASTGNGNPTTGVFLAFIPAIAAAAGVVIYKKRK